MSAQPETNKDVEPLAYGVESAAAALDVSVRTVWNLIEQGKLRKVRIGRRAVIPAADVRAVAEGLAA